MSIASGQNLSSQPNLAQQTRHDSGNHGHNRELSIINRQAETKPLIIHRDAHSIILAGHKDAYATQLINGERPKWGHRADEKQPYKAVGNFINIIPIIDELKQNLPNLKPLHHETTKHIQNVKRSDRSIYKEGSIPPNRTVKFMSDGFKELKCEPKKTGPGKRQAAQRFNLSQGHINLEKAGRGNADGIRVLMEELEKQFMDDPAFDDGTQNGGMTSGGQNFGETQKMGGNSSLRGSPMRGSQGPNATMTGQDKSKKAVASNAKKPENDEVELEKTAESVEYAAFRNQRLGTPRMKKLINKKDGSNMLKDQINESMLRVNAAKFGHSIEEIAPQYTNSYYLPDKSQYVPEKQVSKANKNKNGRPAISGRQYSLNDEVSKSIGGGSMSLPKHHTRNVSNAGDVSPRINFAKQAQVDFMNSKYLGQQGVSPFGDKQQSSLFMTEASMMVPGQSPRLRINVQPNADFTPNQSGSVSRKRPAFNLALQTTTNRLGRINNSMFATTSKQIFQGGHKTSKSSYGGNSSVHTAMTTALTQSQMSTTMMMRMQAQERANRPKHVYDPQNDIQKFIPRQPQRLNEISYRFNTGDQKNSIHTNGEEKRKIGPIDLSALDSRKGPTATRNAAPGASMTATTKGGFGSAFASEFESKMTSDRNMNDPMRKDDLELGIDRSKLDPIKFVSAIDSKPIYPPYLKLADFDSYLQQETSGQNTGMGGTDKKKDGAGNGEKEDQAAQTVTSKKTHKGADGSADYKAEMEEFRENIGELYYEKAVKLMEEIEEKRREEEMAMITLQTGGKLRKSMTKKEKTGEENQSKKSQEAAAKESQNPSTSPPLDENQIRERIEKAGNVFKKFSSLLTGSQEVLLKKLIYSDSMQIDPAVESDGKMMQQLYQLFFAWTTPDEAPQLDESKEAFENLTDEEKYYKAKQKEEERKKKEEFDREQALIEFEERGGFAQVLKDIFNPSDMAAMELDSVFQLKNICKDFYRKKQLMSSALIETLDAQSNERPTVLQMKRRHFNPDVAPNKRESLEWMRINAERERIFRFKTIAKDTASQYYTILERFTQELMNPSSLKQPTKSSSQDGANSITTPNTAAGRLNSFERQISTVDEQNKEASSAQDSDAAKQMSSAKQRGQVFNQVMQSAYKENQQHNVIRFITDYLRQVIENGSRFTAGHFFIMLLQMSASEVKNNQAPYVRILMEELQIPRNQFQRFISGLKDEKLANAFAQIEGIIFDEDQTQE